MIPKIIHYCWLSDDPVPEKLQNFMKSWKKYLPDYEFMKWDFKRFPKDKCAWVSEAFDNKKYAFAADYIRIYALYNYGGIYLDMDVEVLKSFDDLLSLPYFLCYEEDGQGPEVAAFGAGGGQKWMLDWLDYYKDRHFTDEQGAVKSSSIIPLPQVFFSQMKAKGYAIENVKIPNEILNYNPSSVICLLPSDYFSPKSYTDGKVYCTDNTYCIHHFAGSWIPIEQKIEGEFWKFLGLKPHRIMWHVDLWIDKIKALFHHHSK